MKTNFARTARFLLLGLLMALLLAPGLARAQCASPATSVFPRMITICPRGDITTLGVIRNAAGAPCAGVPVTMTIGASCLCGTPISVTAVSNAAGVVSFGPRGGGCCTAPGLVTYRDNTGVVLGASQAVNSPDMSGDCTVNLTDVSLYSLALTSGVYSRCADFNADGVLNLTDTVILAAHFGH